MVEKIQEKIINTLTADKFSYILFAMLFLTLAFSGGMIARYYQKQEEKVLIIAKTISAEACSEGAHGMMGVASTIRNRMEQQGLTAYEVITEPNQYYGLTNPNREKIFEDDQCSEPALKLAEHIEDLPDITKGALYFKTPKEKRQLWHKTLTVVIGRLEFYK